MAACAKQSRAAFFLFKITFLLIPEFLPRRDWGGRKPHGRGAWGETPWSPRAHPPEAASTLCRVAGAVGTADSVSLALTASTSPSLPGAEMIHEPPRRDLKMKNVLAVLGINHRITHPPSLRADLITCRRQNDSPPVPLRRNAPVRSPRYRFSAKNQSSLCSSRKARECFSRMRENKSSLCWRGASQVQRGQTRERQKWL